MAPWVSAIVAIIPVAFAFESCVGGECPAHGGALLQKGVQSMDKLNLLVDNHEDVEEKTGSALMRSGAEQHLQTLSEIVSGTKAVPDSLAPFLNSIRNHSAEIKLMLTTEHNTQSTTLNT